VSIPANKPQPTPAVTELTLISLFFIFNTWKLYVPLKHRAPPDRTKAKVPATTRSGGGVPGPKDLTAIEEETKRSGAEAQEGRAGVSRRQRPTLLFGETREVGKP